MGGRGAPFILFGYPDVLPSLLFLPVADELSVPVKEPGGNSRRDSVALVSLALVRDQSCARACRPWP